MKTLNLLIEAMTEAVDLDKKLEMSSFFETEDRVECDTTIHSCGTAACVLGYGALLSGTTDTMEEKADTLWDELCDEIGNLLGDSIVSPEKWQRLGDAKEYCILHGWPTDWLDDQKHLHTNSTPQDALDYMLEVKSRLLK
jgi:hypothetical protein